MRDVIMRFCRQNNFTKKLYKFIHNNKTLNEDFTYEQLTPINNTRIIYVQKITDQTTSIDSRDNQLVNMENIISKINYPYIKKQTYKAFYFDEGTLSDEGYY